MNTIFRNYILIFLAFAASNLTFSQNSDYKIYRNSLLKLSCKPFDSLTVAEKINDLIQLDTIQFSQNLDYYYNDLAWAYYRLYLHNKDTAFVRLAIHNYLMQTNHSRDYWNLTFCYFIIKDCENGNLNLQLYIENTPIEFRQPEKEIEQLKKKCG
jgi:hypothetical protein